jgi:DoxX
MPVATTSNRLMKLSEHISDAMKCWAPIPLRMIVGYGFMAHGFAKLMKGPDVFVGIVHALGVPAPHLMAWLTIIVELLGGFAVCICAVSQRADGCRTPRRHIHGPSALRFHFNQAHGCDGCGTTIRAARLRSRPFVFGMPCCSGCRWVRAVRRRQIYYESDTEN